MTSAVTFGHKGLMRALCHGISRAFGPISAARAAKEANMLRTVIIALTLTATPALALVPINEEPVIRRHRRQLPDHRRPQPARSG